MATLEQFARRAERVLAQPVTRWAVFSVLAVVAAWPYLRTAGSFNDFRDANVLWLYEDAARRSVLDFGQWPLWNPDFCGGMPLLGTPQARSASPSFLLTLLFGTTRAEPLVVCAMLLVALQGAFAWARERGATHLGAVLGAPVFGLMGLFACAPFLGWLNFLGFAVLPWVLLGLRRAMLGVPSGVLWVGLGVAWMVGFGGTYVVPISLVACAFEVVALAVARRGRLHWGLLTLTAVGTLELSAFRLWPIWEELGRAPRAVAGLSALDLRGVGSFLIGPWPILSTETWYLVPLPALLVAALVLLRRRGVGLGLAFAAWVWLALGSGVTPSAYSLLRRLPLFSMLRGSERFLAAATLVVALAAALAVSDLQARLRLRGRSIRPRRAVAFGWALSCLTLIAVLPWSIGNFFVAASRRALTSSPLEVERPFHQARGNRWSAAQFGPMSRGSLACWEAYSVPQSPRLRADLQHEAWLEEGSAGTLEERRWSPQRLDFRVALARPTRLLINQNYHRGWKSDVGQVVSSDGLLAVDLPVGAQDVHLRFLPTSVGGGALVSGLALVGLMWAVRRRVRELALVVALPALAFGGVLAWSNEPPQPTLVPSGPEGEPVVTDAVPDGVPRLGVRFDDDVVLEGAAVTWRASDDRVRIELDWSHGEAVNPRLGFFVHVEPGTQKRIPADHLQVSDIVFLEAAPSRRVLRDIMLIDVPQALRSETWNVWIGLWEMRGDGHRVPIVEAHGSQVVDQRVLVGSVRPSP